MATFDITIGSTVITLPDVNDDPNWAEGMVEAFQAIADALQQTVGTFDIVPQTYTMVSNVNTDVDISALSFPTASVRGATIRYTIHRSTSTNVEAEYGLLNIVYNENNSTGQKWEMSREFVGSSTVSFDISDDGQILFSSSSLAGTGHTGTISFSASSLETSY